MARIRRGAVKRGPLSAEDKRARIRLIERLSMRNRTKRGSARRRSARAGLCSRNFLSARRTIETRRDIINPRPCVPPLAFPGNVARRGANSLFIEY